MILLDTNGEWPRSVVNVEWRMMNDTNDDNDRLAVGEGRDGITF
jgi:hypothetical protein